MLAPSRVDDEVSRIRTPAQISRFAAKIIRQSLMSGQVKDAYKALIKLHSRTFNYHNHKPSSAAADSPPLRPLPLRLATTTLIHGLMRIGLTQKASTVLVDAMNGHAPVRFRKFSNTLTPEHRVILRVQTLESMVAALCPAAGSAISIQGPLVNEVNDMRRLERAMVGKAENGGERSKEDGASKDAGLKSSSRLDQNTRRAITLLNMFRQYRYRRSKEMYGRVIDACLLQGEIITACLLFVLLVKDWQVRSVLRQARALPEPLKEPLDPSIEPDAPHHTPLRGLFWTGETHDSLVYIAPDNIRLPVTHVANIPLNHIIPLGLHDSSLYIPPPPDHSLLKIVRHLNLHLSPESSKPSTNSKPPDPNASLRGRLASPKDSYEVLEYLVHLLHERALPDRRISSLIAAMSSIPPHLKYYVDRAPLMPLRRRKNRTRHPVTPSNATPSESSPYDTFAVRLRPLPNINFRKQVSLYAFSNAVLLDLISSPPSPDPDSASISPHMLPVLDRRSFNALLHYALRNKKSLQLAQKVLDGMREHERGIDTVTANIILRGASLLRVNADVHQAMALFDRPSRSAAVMEPSGNKHHETTETDAMSTDLVHDDDGVPNASMPEAESDLSAQHAEPSHCTSEPADSARSAETLPTLIIPHRNARDPIINPDKYTITSVLAHRTSSGIHFLDALRILRTSMPLLSVPDTLRTSSTAAAPSTFGITDVQHPHKMSTMIPTFPPSRRAKHDFTGPLPYTVILNMLAKAGLYRKAEKLFWLAKKAERKSWKLGRVRFLVALQKTPGGSLRRQAGGPMWRPWCLPVEAYTVMMQCHAIERRSFRGPLHHQGKEWRSNMGHRTYWEMMAGAWRIYDSLVVLHDLLANDDIRDGEVDHTSPDRRGDAPHRGLTYALGGSIPIPDARFFNAALQMFSRNQWFGEGQRSDLGQSSPQTHRTPYQAYDEDNYRMLERIAADIRRFGYPVPKGVLEVLREREAGLEPQPLNIRFSIPQAAHPFRLPAAKDRGLVRRRYGGGKIREKRWTNSTRTRRTNGITLE